jgi:serine protease Do
MASRTTLIVLVAVFCVSSAGMGDTIVLKDGGKIVGNVLRADEKAVIVEVGSQVLRLPRSEVAELTRDSDSASQPATAGSASQPASALADGASPTEKAAPEWQLFRTADLQPASIERNAERSGQAVVMVSCPNGQGSGFVISPDGYCVTNYHVIAQETRVKVTVFCKTATGFEQKHYNKVKIVALNPFIDLALLKIDAEDDAGAPFAYAYLGSMDDLKVGQDVFAIGNPLGLTRTVSQGIVSTTNRNFEGRLYIQTTTDINPGNSGGPLFNNRGEVVGVTSMGYIYLGGLNFAIPVDVVKRFIINRDAFAYDEDNPNSGHRYLQPAGRQDTAPAPAGRLPTAGEQGTEPVVPADSGGRPD